MLWVKGWQHLAFSQPVTTSLWSAVSNVWLRCCATRSTHCLAFIWRLTHPRCEWEGVWTHVGEKPRRLRVCSPGRGRSLRSGWRASGRNSFPPARAHTQGHGPHYLLHKRLIGDTAPMWGKKSEMWGEEEVGKPIWISCLIFGILRKTKNKQTNKMVNVNNWKQTEALWQLQQSLQYVLVR